MSDSLEQLLRDVDSSTSIPEIDAENVSQRVRRKARNQRRLAACGLAILPVTIAGFVLLFILHSRQQPLNVIEATATHPQAPTNPSLDAVMHERVAELVQSAELQKHPRSDPSDAFLFELKMQRNHAALLLVNDAQHSLDTQDPLAAAAALRRAIQLFPDTPAAMLANKELQQISPSMRQS